MKNGLAISLGLCMILAALLLAARTNSQDLSVQPVVAQRFATQLHQTPSATPTSTGTPTPTGTPPPPPTPIPGWTRVQAGGIQLWLPPNFDVVERVVNPGAVGYSSRTLDGAALVLYAVDSSHDPPMSVTTFQLIRLRSGVRSLSLLSSQFDVGTEEFTSPVLMDFDGFPAFRSFSEAVVSTGTRVRKGLYLVKQGDGYWLMVYTTAATEFNVRFPDFEESIHSFSIVGRP